MPPMIAIADDNLADLTGTFGACLEVRPLPGRAIGPDDLGEAEVLLVRSVTRVDEALLGRSRVRFVGTATIGTDHLDTDWLDAAGITWAHAPGCNADAAAQYALAHLFLAARRLGRDWRALRVGLLGHGNVGSRLRRLLDALGLVTVVRDPPMAAAGVLPERALEDVLACDVVSLHVPLTHGGAWPTAGLIDAAALARLPQGALLVNTARGGVVDGEALDDALAAERIHAALDVWPNEPRIDPRLLAATTTASPHVAGYSVEGKHRGTRQIFEAFLRWADRTSPPGPKPGAAAPTQTLTIGPEADPVAAAVIACTGIEADDERLRTAGPVEPAVFDRLRRAHLPRHEFASVCLRAPEAANDAVEALDALGFRILRP